MKKFLRFTALTLLIAVAVCTLASCSGIPYDYELDEYIRIADYSKIKIDEEKIPELTEQYKSDLIAAHSVKSTTPITDRPLKNGDIAVVTYKCFENEAVQPIVTPDESPALVLQDTNCEIVIGRGKYLPEFEKSLSGLTSLPRSYTVTAAVPGDYGLNKLAGKTVTYSITVTAAYELIVPEYNDEFIAQNTRYSNIAEYEEAINEKARYQLIWDELVAQSEIITYPQNELSDHTLDFIEYYTNQATMSSLTLEQYVARKFFIELSAFHLKADEYSKNYTKEELLVYNIARKNELEPSEEEYQEKATAYATEYGYDTLFDYESVYGKNFIKYSILKDKVKRHVALNSLSGTAPADSDSSDIFSH